MTEDTPQKSLVSKAASHSAVRFLVVGVVMNLLLYLLYAGIVYLDLLPAFQASGTVYVVGVLTNYLANKGITFSYKGNTLKSFSKYLAVYGFVFGLTMLSVYLLNKLLGNPYVAQFLTMGYIAVINYFLLKLFVFPKAKEATATNQEAA